MTTNFTPIVRSAAPYVNGLQMSYTSTTTLTVANGICSDSSNNFDLTLADDTLLNIATTGLNGLDTGTVAINTWYYVYVVADPIGLNTTGVIMSLSATAPTLPVGLSGSVPYVSGYSAFRRIGALRLDGSAHLPLFLQTGADQTRLMSYPSLITVLSAGHATSSTAVSVIGAVPPIANCQAQLVLAYIPATAGNFGAIYTHGFSPVANSSITGQVAGVTITGQFSIPITIDTGAPFFNYAVSNASDALYALVYAYEDYL